MVWRENKSVECKVKSKDESDGIICNKSQSSPRNIFYISISPKIVIIVAIAVFFLLVTAPFEVNKFSWISVESTTSF